jgi:hypothetical protein
MQYIRVIKKRWPVIVICTALIFSISLLNVFGYYSEKLNVPVNSRSKLKKRLEYLLQSWPAIIKNPNKTNIFIGTSVFQYFLDPRVYDEELLKFGIEMRSFNLAFEGNIGIGLTSYVYRLNSECEKNNVLFDTVFFEIIPSAENKKFFHSHQNMIEIGNPDVFLDKNTWTKLFFKDPISSIYLSFSNLAQPLRWEYLMYSLITSKKIDPNLRKFAGITNFWSLPYFYEKPEWNIKTAGLVNWNFPESRTKFDEAMNFVHSPEQWSIFLKEYVNGNGISKNFKYEENLIDQYIQAINSSKKFAKQVIIIKLPTAPSFQALVDQYVNEEYMLNRVRKETGVKILDYTKIGQFTDNDFADPMHLRKETMNYYLKILAKDISNIKNSANAFK